MSAQKITEGKHAMKWEESAKIGDYLYIFLEHE